MSRTREVAAATALSQTPPRSILNEGVAAFKAARYAQAVELFQQAANAAPSDPVPRLYLGQSTCFNSFRP